MTKLSKSAFLSKYATIFADNTTRNISEGDMREFVQDVADSFLVDTEVPAEFWPLSGLAALTGNVEIDLGSNKLTVGGTTNLVWYKDTADNSGGGTDLETTTDLDIFSQFPTNYPSNGYFVVALVKIKASAVQAGDEGTGFYASEKIYTIRRTYAPEVIIEGGEVATYQHGDNEALNHTLTVEGTDVRLTVTTPAGDTYSWNVVAEIVYSSIFYEV